MMGLGFLVMYLATVRNDVISYEINDAAHFVRNDEMVAFLFGRSPYIISVSDITAK